MKDRQDAILYELRAIRVILLIAGSAVLVDAVEKLGDDFWNVLLVVGIFVGGEYLMALVKSRFD